VRLFLAEACFALWLAAFALWAPLPPAPAIILSVLLLGLAFVPALSRPAGEGRLRKDRIPVLISVFLLSTSIRFPPAEGFAGWWPAAVALPVLLCGLYLTLKERFPWSRTRREVTLSAAVLLAASAAVAGMFRGVLAFRSSQAIAPGDVDFLLVALVWAAAWFGLDAVFRSARESREPGAAAWLFDRRHPLGLGICLLVILLRSTWG
jgi:hypothetical protein